MSPSRGGAFVRCVLSATLGLAGCYDWSRFEHSSERPGASNTGPRSQSLTPLGTTSFTEGRVVSGFELSGTSYVEIRADVVFRDCRLASTAERSITVHPGASLVIEDCEVVIPSGYFAIVGGNLTLRRVDVHGAGGAMILNGPAVIEDCWFHNDAAGTGGMVVRADSGHDITLRHNDITGFDSAVFAHETAINALAIEDNWIDVTGNIPIDVPQAGPGTRITRNRFGQNYGAYPASPIQASPDATISDNVSLVDGSPVH